MSKVEDIQARLRSLGDQGIADRSMRFFRTGKGEYGEGDRFLGIRVPALRKQLREFAGVSLDDVGGLLFSPFHEERLFALLLLVVKFERGSGEERQAVYDFYIRNRNRVNNWDLVDSSAPHIAGAWLEGREKTPLYELARSASLWDRRIAIVATFHFIRRNRFDDTLNIAGLLKHDREDLIHKAVGWMLREVGKRDARAEKEFLRLHAVGMPRTMLRYAIERFPEPERRQYLKNKAVS
ncbi:DNA alkylation repair protein [Prosthecochloris sp. GSB1]|uniref:DNA alkylation repair protein n=1 Tax=Prosthecochloris sp. GSB1 TaxID=281093 RepID=UPI000B8C807B|nr:DNA alkylation repair protein [Prosthecochloris sp. GSB1]ASQ91092.1 DNA alkylation repair protein [Prosthecochloris sp. GSB1]